MLNFFAISFKECSLQCNSNPLPLTRNIMLLKDPISNGFHKFKIIVFTNSQSTAVHFFTHTIPPICCTVLIVFPKTKGQNVFCKQFPLSLAAYDHDANTFEREREGGGEKQQQSELQTEEINASYKMSVRNLLASFKHTYYYTQKTDTLTYS